MWVEEPDGDLEEAREQLTQHLLDKGFNVELSGRGASVRTNGTDEYGSDGVSVATMKVAIIHCPGFQPIHLLVTDSPLEAVLDVFDISTHQVGISPDGQYVRGADFTPLDQPPYVLRDTPTTPARMEKITRRYAAFREEAVY